MFFTQHTRLIRWLAGIAVSALSCAVIFWVSAHLFLPSFIQKNVSEIGAKIGYDIAYQDLSISPLRLKVELGGLHLAKEGGSKLLEFQKLAITLKWTKIVLGEISFDEILLEKPKLIVEKRLYKDAQAGVWNWQDFITAIKKLTPPSDPNSPQKPIKISIDEFKATSASLSLLDESSGLKEELKPLTVILQDVANYDKQGVITGVRGQYEFNLGALQLLIPGINKSINYQHVAITGGLDNSALGNLGVQLNVKLDDGAVRSHWDLNATSKSVDAKLEIQNLAIAPMIPLLPTNKTLIGKSGAINAELSVKLEGDTDVVGGDIHISDLTIQEKDQKQALIVWKMADIRQLEFKSIKSKQATENSLAISELTIDGPTLQFEINVDGFSNFRRLFAKPEAEHKSEVSDSSRSNSASKLNLHIRSVNLKSWEVFFSDLAMRPHFKVDIKKFNATLLGVSNVPGRFASVAMDGVVAGSGSMRAKGQASFDDPRRNHDILTTFRNLPLSAFNPAVMTFAGYQIASGRLNLNLNYKAKDGDLSGSNQIIIKKVVLGEEVPDFNGKRLPLGLAIALLENSDDTIDVTVRIAGNVDSPEFSARSQGTC